VNTHWWVLLKKTELQLLSLFTHTKGPFGWGADLNGMVPFQFLRMEPLRSTFGKKNGAAPFFVWLESTIESGAELEFTKHSTVTILHLLKPINYSII
jgi:hypothetical protein